MKFSLVFVILFLSGYYYFNYVHIFVEEPSNFREAKQYVADIYEDRRETFYCGCSYELTGSTSGSVNHESCGYKIRTGRVGGITEGLRERAERIEYEHVFPASWFGYKLSCWEEGGRSYCSQNDGLFNFMESDIINLVPSIGQVNGDRSNYEFSEFNYVSSPQYGECKVVVNFREKAFEPREEVKGEIARIMFYMHDGYGVDLSKEQELMYMRWNNLYPVSDWELERNRRIRQRIGRNNPYVSGEKVWVEDQELSGFMLEYYEGEVLSGDSGFNIGEEEIKGLLNKLKSLVY